MPFINVWDESQYDEDGEESFRCKRCGSTDVRWRFQGGKWVLFSLEPGKLHQCPIETDAFDVVPE